MAGTRQSSRRLTTKAASQPAFTEDEVAAMKERAAEVKASRGRSWKAGQRQDAQAVMEKIVGMDAADRVIAERLHQIITTVAPGLAPKLWYGMPAYTKDGKVVCFFQEARKFKCRYATLGFQDAATLDDGAMWPTSYAVMTLTEDVENQVVALIRQAAG